MRGISYQWRIYLHGLIAAMANGIGGSAVVVMVDPTDFNLFQGGFLKLATVGAASAVFSFFTYIKEHPLPDPKKDTDYAAEVRVQIADLKKTGTGDGGPPKSDITE